MAADAQELRRPSGTPMLLFQAIGQLLSQPALAEGDGACSVLYLMEEQPWPGL